MIKICIAHNFLISLNIVAMIASFEAHAVEAATYTYDTQGQPVLSVITGMVNNVQLSSIIFDAANNRINYTISIAHAAATSALQDQLRTRPCPQADGSVA